MNTVNFVSVNWLLSTSELNSVKKKKKKKNKKRITPAKKQI